MPNSKNIKIYPFKKFDQYENGSLVVVRDKDGQFTKVDQIVRIHTQYGEPEYELKGGSQYTADEMRPAIELTKKTITQADRNYFKTAFGEHANVIDEGKFDKDSKGLYTAEIYTINETATFKNEREAYEFAFQMMPPAMIYINLFKAGKKEDSWKEFLKGGNEQNWTYEGWIALKERVFKGSEKFNSSEKYDQIRHWGYKKATNEDIDLLLEAIIEVGYTDQTISPPQTKTGTQYQKALDKKTTEVFNKIKDKNLGSLKGNLAFGCIYTIIDNTVRFKWNILSEYKNRQTSNPSDSETNSLKSKVQNLYERTLSDKSNFEETEQYEQLEMEILNELRDKYNYDFEDHPQDMEYILHATPSEIWKYHLDVILPKLQSKKTKGKEFKDGGEINYKGIESQIENLIKTMIENKVARKTMTITSDSGYKAFMNDVQPAIDKKLLTVSSNPINKKELWIRLGSNAKLEFKTGGEISTENQEKIKKLQAVVNSAMMPEAVKEKAKAQIATLESESQSNKAAKSQPIDNAHRHTYMMLGRLQMDNDYFLGHGNRSEKHLWAGNVKDQINEMKTLWDKLPINEKPEWLTMEQILDYEQKMKLPISAENQEKIKKLQAVVNSPILPDAVKEKAKAEIEKLEDEGEKPKNEKGFLRFKKGDIVYAFQHLPKNETAPKEFIVEENTTKQVWAKIQIVDVLSDEKGHERYKAKLLDGYYSKSDGVMKKNSIGAFLESNISMQNEVPIPIGYVDQIVEIDNARIKKGSDRRKAEFSKFEINHQELSEKTGIRIAAVAKFIETNDLNAAQVDKLLTAIKNNEISGSDVAIGIVGNKGNSYWSKVIKIVDPSRNTSKEKVEKPNKPVKPANNTQPNTGKKLKDISDYITRRNIENVNFTIDKTSYTVGHNDLFDGIYVPKKAKGIKINDITTFSSLKPKTGKLSQVTVYISNRFITSATIKRNGQTQEVKDILDGIYVKKEFFKGNIPTIPRPKVTRTQFEEEEYTFKTGGTIPKSFNESKVGDLVLNEYLGHGKVTTVYNDSRDVLFWDKARESFLLKNIKNNQLGTIMVKNNQGYSSTGSKIDVSLFFTPERIEKFPTRDIRE